MVEDHSERLRRAFTTQAAAFEDVRLNRVFTEDARWLFEPLRCAPTDLLLDVAAGTGHAARELAGRVRTVVAVDVTPAMLAAGGAAAREEGIDNVVFQLGDAARLPFIDRSFDVVVSRFALHHMQDPILCIAEMARCLRPGGRIAIADMVANEHRQIAAEQNRLEDERDPSHTRMLPVSELERIVNGLGLTHLATEAREFDRALDPWLEQAQTPPLLAAAIRDELSREIAGGPVTGMQPHVQDGELRFCQTWAVLLAVKPEE